MLSWDLLPELDLFSLSLLEGLYRLFSDDFDRSMGILGLYVVKLFTRRSKLAFLCFLV